MIEVANVSLPLDAGLPGNEHLLIQAAAKVLQIEEQQIASVRVLKRSVDARKKQNVHFVATLGVVLRDAGDEQRSVETAQGSQVRIHADYVPLSIPSVGARDGASMGVDEAMCGREGCSGEAAASGDADEATRSRRAFSGEAVNSGSADEEMQGQSGFSGELDSTVCSTAVGSESSSPQNAAVDSSRPVVVGMGPAGLFAALYLAKAGMRPIVIERGQAVEQRLRDVEEFNRDGILRPDSNIQFGEGGAGTFSDGKLTTNTKNPYTAHVLRWFADAGAPEEILWQAKPHIGTDHLVGIVRTIRKQIIALGGEVLFASKLSGLRFAEDEGEGGLRLAAIEVTDLATDEVREIETEQVIVATGHSARDTFEMLHEKHLLLEQKPFSVGVRIEHSQNMIDRSQYGTAAEHPALGAAEYKMAVHLDSGRSVYTFCMCPGGEVVCAASEPETVVVNGMSRFARDAANANSALLVGVEPSDFGSDHPLAGVEFQRRIERAAYEAAHKAGGTAYQAPAQKVGDFLTAAQGKRENSKVPRSESSNRTIEARADTHDVLRAENRIEPSYARGVAWCDLHECLPVFVTDALAEALPLFDRKLKGFATEDAIMTGVETRSSSPVRIRRNETFQAFDGSERTITGVYPCGEGAGYAGGIMSAAVDGLRVAEKVAQQSKETNR